MFRARVFLGILGFVVFRVGAFSGLVFGVSAFGG